MNAVEALAGILREHNVPFKTRDGGILVAAADDEGYQVWMRPNDVGGHTVGFESWHMEFDDETNAIATFMSGLTDGYRLRVVRSGDTDYRWTIQYPEGPGWRNGSTVGIFRFTLFRRKKLRYIRNQRLVAPNTMVSV